MLKSAKGFTAFVDRNWEQVKPDKVNFEREVHEKMCAILESETSRLEFVGTGMHWSALSVCLISSGDIRARHSSS